MSSPTVLLEAEVARLLDALDTHPVAARLFDGTIAREPYTRFLTQSYHFVRWTQPLLSMAANQLERIFPADGFAAAMDEIARNRLGNLERIESDLRALGHPLASVDDSAPCPAIDAFVAWSRFAASGRMAPSIFGTAFVLEAVALRRAPVAVERLVQSSTIPGIREAVLYMRGTGSVDNRRLHGLGRLIETLASDEARDAVITGAGVTRALFVGLFDGCLEGVDTH